MIKTKLTFDVKEDWSALHEMVRPWNPVSHLTGVVPSGRFPHPLEHQGVGVIDRGKHRRSPNVTLQVLTQLLPLKSKQFLFVHLFYGFKQRKNFRNLEFCRRILALSLNTLYSFIFMGKFIFSFECRRKIWTLSEKPWKLCFVFSIMHK